MDFSEMFDPLPEVPARRGAVATMRRQRGFTLIELLVVIAIIAILAAIIFPVAAGVQESARRASCMTNMKTIYQAVKQYQLDNREYPEYLLGPTMNTDGYIYDGTNGDPFTMDQVAAVARGNNNPTDDATRDRDRRVRRVFSTSLFPEYINDLSVFHCPNNVQARTTSTADSHKAVRFVGDVKAGDPLQTVSFYDYSSYDASPRISNTEELNTAEDYRVARYARMWTGIYDPATLEPTSVPTLEDYKNQLYWKLPSDDSYITMCTYHVPKGKVIVLWLNGNAKVLDTRKILSNGTYGNMESANSQTDLAQVYKLGPNE